jgi:hypothetical protein
MEDTKKKEKTLL